MGICRHWRAVALANALLWADISVTHNIDLLQLFLQRSRDAHIRIEYLYANDDVVHPSRTNPDFLKPLQSRIAYDSTRPLYSSASSFNPLFWSGLFALAISTHTHRIQVLSIRSPVLAYLTEIFQNYDLRFDELEHLELLLDHPTRFGFLGPASRFPKLRVVSTACLFFQFDDASLNKLTHLELVDNVFVNPLAAMVPFLRLCANLESLHMSFPSAKDIPKSHPQLRRAESDETSCYPSCMTSSSKAPSLMSNICWQASMFPRIFALVYVAVTSDGFTTMNLLRQHPLFSRCSKISCDWTAASPFVSRFATEMRIRAVLSATRT
ncbi:hypothetical protein OBBRIDRAFT_833818 [Obba rivulosa]|uniref:F-box domain-containing protein n=1 Tax=Obba rivulosa TaxID=1052685 RepID=A0A8E2AW20_9APHY|nr:hypothetical protein OBBRIDRAFT_833818 [Obba rivulosa]